MGFDDATAEVSEAHRVIDVAALGIGGFDALPFQVVGVVCLLYTSDAADE